MKSFKMIAVAVLAFGVGSLVMVAGAALLNQEVTHAQTHQSADVQQPAGTSNVEQSPIIRAAIETAQEATSMTQ